MSSHLRDDPAVIEKIRPELDCGRYRAKAIVGDAVQVTADIFRDGPSLLQAVVRYRGPSDRRWGEAPMTHLGNDRWAGAFSPTTIGRYRYAIEAWTDEFGTWRRGLGLKVDAGVNVELELAEGALLLEARLKSIPQKQRRIIEKAIDAIRGPGSTSSQEDPRVVAALDEEILAIMHRYSDRTGSTTTKPVLELWVDRERARFGAWYEFFPRSTGPAGKHGTFKTAAKELARIADMGFDVVYLPPIHPIGTTNRKGKNNTLEPSSTDVGVPWAIGSSEGGHKDIHPKLGTLKDFDAFVAEADRLGLEICLDFAIQTSPDHPWVKEHPEWFKNRPDGSIQFAENPPKKYQDIYPVDFGTEDRQGLWNELKSVLDHWIDHGVKIFRVDNPHTKAFSFWEWVIEEIRAEHPDVIFLAEAFTKPKVMQALAKLGFTQSYTYFTWRNHRHEIEEYLTELTTTEMADYFRPNFFVNTPDILHEYLQSGGPPAFKIRLVLAALLSPTYGVYSGYELCENVPVQQGSEEYLNSEKYELKRRDWNSPDNLAPFIAKINDIRASNPALRQLTNLTFHGIDKDHMMAFSKRTEGSEAILIVINLNPFHFEDATTSLDLDALGVDGSMPFEVTDLISGSRFVWHGPHNYVRLDPNEEPAHIFSVGQ